MKLEQLNKDQKLKVIEFLNSVLKSQNHSASIEGDDTIIISHETGLGTGMEAEKFEEELTKMGLSGKEFSSLRRNFSFTEIDPERLIKYVEASILKAQQRVVVPKRTPSPTDEMENKQRQLTENIYELKSLIALATSIEKRRNAPNETLEESLRTLKGMLEALRQKIEVHKLSQPEEDKKALQAIRAGLNECSDEVDRINLESHITAQERFRRHIPSPSANPERGKLIAFLRNLAVIQTDQNKKNALDAFREAIIAKPQDAPERLKELEQHRSTLDAIARDNPDFNERYTKWNAENPVPAPSTSLRM